MVGTDLAEEETTITSDRALRREKQTDTVLTSKYYKEEYDGEKN